MYMRPSTPTNIPACALLDVPQKGKGADRVSWQGVWDLLQFLNGEPDVQNCHKVFI